jgi:serine/threonine-protein kinase
MSPLQQIAHFRIVAKLGEGGMGAVYRATDTKLNRDVAIKVLPESFASDPDRMARFQREAHVLAAVNHVNIAAIYAVEEAALVMELVEGESLRQVLDRGPLPLETALTYAAQICDGVEAAHERGVVHRDLKPANIMVNAAGQIKILDFGLAAVLQGSAVASSNPANSPTLTMQATQAGVILGTAGYMSPEQAAGKPVDKRADIWSFGVVLYEMLTGSSLFDGETTSHIMADVLRGPIDLDRLPAQTPPYVRALLGRCLDRNVRIRLRDIGEARIALQKADHPPPPAPATASTVWIWPAIAGLLLLSIAILAVREWRSTAAPAAAPVRASLDLTPAEQLAGDPFGRPRGPAMAISPDGNLLVFAGSQGATRQLYKRSLDQPEAAPIPGTDGAGRPFFSPDGQWIGFFAGDAIRKVALSGGPPVDICGNVGQYQFGATWGAGNSIVFADRALKQVAADGGTPHVILPAEPANKRYFTTPSFLPDGKTLLATRFQTDWQKAEIVVIPEGGAPRVLIQGGTNPLYAASGHLIFLRGATLLAAPFDLRKLAVTGSPAPLLSDVMVSLDTSNMQSESGAGQFAVSRNGTLIYATGGLYPQPTASLARLDRKGAITELGIKGPLFQLRFSPDGQKLSAGVRHGQTRVQDVLVYDLARGTAIPLASVDGFASVAWAPDGKRIALQVGIASIGLMPVGGQGSTEIVAQANEEEYPASWSVDGKWLAYLQEKDGRRAQIRVKPMSPPGEPILFVDSKAEAMDATFSPDGKWIAYMSTETGPPEIFVQPFPGPGEKIRISTGVGTNPAWAPNGRELFYLAPGKERSYTRMIAVTVDTAAGFRAGAPHELFTLPADQSFSTQPVRSYDVYPDGQHFIAPLRNRVKSDPVVRLQIVLNWFAELQRRVPAK